MKDEPERLLGVAIIRNGKMLAMDRGSHSQLRGWKEPEPDDICGYHTSADRFVSRATAHLIGLKSGQCSQQERELLSSDIVWEAKPQKVKPECSGKRWPNKKKLF